MGPGVVLAIVGAILLFAVRQTNGVIDVNIVGLILLVAGGLLIANAHYNTTRKRVVEEVDDRSDPARPRHTVTESFTDRDGR